MVRKSIALLVLLVSSFAANADDWGCEVLLCLANPAGPMAAASCVPPITRLYDALSQRPPQPFPTCASANGAAAARQGYNFFDECPSGTTALTSGKKGLQLSREQYNNVINGYPLNVNTVYVGVGTGEGYGGADVKSCVAGELGGLNIGDIENPLYVTVFERITTMAPNTSPRYIDVFINSQKFNRVRW